MNEINNSKKLLYTAIVFVITSPIVVVPVAIITILVLGTGRHGSSIFVLFSVNDIIPYVKNIVFTVLFLDFPYILATLIVYTAEKSCSLSRIATKFLFTISVVYAVLIISYISIYMTKVM